MYTLLDCIKHKCRDSYVLYIPTVHAPSVWYYLHTLFWYRHTHMTFLPPVPFIELVKGEGGGGEFLLGDVKDLSLCHKLQFYNH